MTSQSVVVERAAIRRALSWALVAALCVAALTAIGAVLTGDFDETDVRVIVSSVGFGVFSVAAGSGASLRYRGSRRLQALGNVTVAVCALAFLLLLAALWTDGEDETWRWFGVAALAALACSHASLVAGALRAADSAMVGALAKASIGLATLDAFVGMLAVGGALDDVNEGSGQAMAVLVILLLLTTALPPILRRLQRPAVAAATQTNGLPTPLPLAAEVLAVADRIDALNADPGNRAPEIMRECERLRQLARSHSR